MKPRGLGEQMHRARDAYDRLIVALPRGRRLPAALCALAVAGCGADEPAVPVPCTEGAQAVRSALRAAPEAVRMEGVPISACLSADSDGADVQVVGSGLVEAATGLAREARRDPSGRAALELGYLVGAARRGGDRSQGVHYELLRRLEQEAAPMRGRSAAFRRGERAGRRAG